MTDNKDGEEDMQVTDRKNRFIHIVFILMEAIIALIIYLSVVALTGHGIPCFFRRLTGLQCPGCGMTHAIFSFIHGNYAEAIRYNILSVTICPLIGLFLIIKSIKYINTGEEEFTYIDVFFLITCLITCVLFFILRNHLI